MVWPAVIGAAAAIGGGLLSNRANKQIASQNVAMQREFAQQGVRWKVEDAKAAGIHPLYALGASTAQFQPIAVQDSMGPALANAGQDISRAMYATQTAQERRDAEATAFMQAQVAASDARVLRAGQERRAEEAHAVNLQGQQLQNELLASQIARLRATPNPPFPGGPIAPRSVPPGTNVVEPSRTTSPDRSDPARAAGVEPSFRRYQVTPGVTVDLPGQQLSESLEGLGALGHILGPVLTGTHSLNKVWSGHSKPDDKLLPPGYRWEWNRWKQSWSAVRSR